MTDYTIYDEYESIQDGFIAINREWRYTYINLKAASMFGRPPEDLLGKIIWEEHPNLWGTELEEACHKAMDRQILQRLDRKFAHSGLWYNVFICPSEEGLWVYWQDITEQKQNAEVLSESNKRLTRLINAQSQELNTLKESLAAEVKALTKLHTLTKEFTRSHESLDQMLEAILGAAFELTAAHEGAIHLPQEYAQYLKNPTHHYYEEACFDPMLSQTVEVTETLKHGPVFVREDAIPDWNNKGIYSLHLTSLFSSSGNFIGVLATHHQPGHRLNERDQKMLELLTRQGADAIERVKSTQELAWSENRALTLIEELRKMDENKNEFLNMLSHELRNPLASITMSQALLERAPYGGEQYLHAKEILDRQTKHLTRLVDDLLDITRITRNKVKLKKEPIELNDLIAKIVKDYKTPLEHKSVHLDSQLTDNPLYLEGDPARLTQVLGNLLHNASKFTSVGDRIRITVWEDVDKQEAIINVEDTGIGIDPDVLHDLFQPFIQVDNTLGRNNNGLGLGLAIVKSLVDLHGGTVTAFSEGLGKGTRFSIHLPLHSGPRKDPKSKKTDAEAAPSQVLRMLVIDDLPDIAEILCSLLRHLGHEAISANSGPEGIDKARDYRPDVILCDIGLPFMNGHEIAQSIRKDANLKNTFLIAVSGYAQSNDIERAMSSGFDRHLAKPVDLAILKNLLGDFTPPPRKHGIHFHMRAD